MKYLSPEGGKGLGTKLILAEQTFDNVLWETTICLGRYQLQEILMALKISASVHSPTVFGFQAWRELQSFSSKPFYLLLFLECWLARCAVKGSGLFKMQPHMFWRLGWVETIEELWFAALWLSRQVLFCGSALVPLALFTCDRCKLSTRATPTFTSSSKSFSLFSPFGILLIHQILFALNHHQVPKFTLSADVHWLEGVW